MNETNQADGQAPLLRSVKGLMLGRVIVITFLWAALVSVERLEGATPASQPLTYIIVITYFLTILYILFLSQRPNLERFYLAQVGVDLVLESAIVQSAGGLHSGFAFLYILSIISAGVALPRRHILGVAFGASLLYSLLAYLEFNGLIHPLPFPFALRGEAVPSRSYVFYSALLVLTAFWLVAVLSSYLAESLRRTGEVLREQTEHLIGLRAVHENVVSSMNSGLLITDMTGRVISCNDAGERILLLSPGELQGRPSREVFSFLNIDDILPRAETLDQGLNRAEGVFERRDGRKVILGVSYSPLRDEKGTIYGLIFNFQDITTIRAMESEIKRGEQLAALGRLSAAIAHEIRNPLASISGSIQLLRSDLVLDESNQRLMDIVAREIERLNAVITDFLAYGRPRPLEFVEVDVHKLIAGTLGLLSNGLPQGSEVTIRSQWSTDVPLLMADPQGLRDVIWNLCLNAVEAMDYRGALTVCTTVQTLPRLFRPPHAGPPMRAQELIIDVTNTGPGMPPDVKEKIFEPFYSTKKGGTGLGLAIVNRIISDHMGRIEVDSEAGLGTTMRIHLPLLAVKPSPQPSP